MFNPEPPSVTAGRKFLYDATVTSALGDQACASCHIGGDFDGLAWDLGNPGDAPLPITTGADAVDLHAIPDAAISARSATRSRRSFAAYQPLKGPMTTQSLRGLDNHGADALARRPQRRRPADRRPVPRRQRQPGRLGAAERGIFDELQRVQVVQRRVPRPRRHAAQLSDADMTASRNFMLQSRPTRRTRSATSTTRSPRTQAAGHAFYFTRRSPTAASSPSDSVPQLQRLPHPRPQRQRGRDARTRASSAPTAGSRSRTSRRCSRSPHLRNAYQKVGMYSASVARRTRWALPPFVPPLDAAARRPVAAVRGFGYDHDGIEGTVEQFLSPRSSSCRRRCRHLRAAVTLAAEPGRHPVLHRSEQPAHARPSWHPSRRRVSQLRRGARVLRPRRSTQHVPHRRAAGHARRRRTPRRRARIALLEAQAAAGNVRPRRARHRHRADTGFVVHGRELGVRRVLAAAVSPTRSSAPQLAEGSLPLTFLRRPAGRGLARRRRPRRRRLRGRRRAPPARQRRPRRHAPQRARHALPRPGARGRGLPRGRGARHHRAPARGSPSHRGRRRRRACARSAGAHRRTFNLEMAATDEMVAIAARVRPDVCTLVPERREERTTEGGLDVVGGGAALAARVRALVDAGIKVSLFIAADAAQIDAVARRSARADRAPHGRVRARQRQGGARRAWRRGAAAQAHGLGLEVAAGHGLTQDNVPALVAIPEIVELNIGHAVVADAVFVGHAGGGRARTRRPSTGGAERDPRSSRARRCAPSTRTPSRRARVPGVVLMENAGRGATDVLVRELLGGDARGRARRRRLRRPATTAATGSSSRGTCSCAGAEPVGLPRAATPARVVAGRARQPRRVARPRRRRARSSRSTARSSALRRALAGADVVVDALFGTGLDRAVDGYFADVVAAINAARRRRASPSTSPRASTPTRAASLGVARRGRGHRHVRAPQARPAHAAGRAPRGRRPRRRHRRARRASSRTSAASAQLLEPSDVARWIVGRAAPGRAQERGGARRRRRRLAGQDRRAAARRRAGRCAPAPGLATIATWPDAATAIEAHVLEVMTARIDPQAVGESLDAILAGKHAVVVGPGFGLGDDARDRRRVRPGVVARARRRRRRRAHDVRGAPERSSWPPRRPSSRRTPASSRGSSARRRRQVEADRFRAAREAVAATGAVVVLKGAHTIVASPDSRLAVTPGRLPGARDRRLGRRARGHHRGPGLHASPRSRRRAPGVMLHAAGRRGLVARRTAEPTGACSPRRSPTHPCPPAPRPRARSRADTRLGHGDTRPRPIALFPQRFRALARGIGLAVEAPHTRRTRCPPPLPDAAASPQPPLPRDPAPPAPPAPRRRRARPARAPRRPRRARPGAARPRPSPLRRPRRGRRHRPGHGRAGAPLRGPVRARHEPARVGLPDPLQRLRHAVAPPPSRAQRAREPRDRSVRVDGARAASPRPTRPGRAHARRRGASSTRCRRGSAP